MPIYDYECGHCHGTVSMLRTVAHRHDPATCTKCHQGLLRFRISAPRTVITKSSAFRATTPQQQLAGPSVTGPGLRSKVKSSVLHQCVGPNCSVCT